LGEARDREPLASRGLDSITLPRFQQASPETAQPTYGFAEQRKTCLSSKEIREVDGAGERGDLCELPA